MRDGGIACETYRAEGGYSAYRAGACYRGENFI